MSQVLINAKLTVSKQFMTEHPLIALGSNQNSTYGDPEKTVSCTMDVLEEAGLLIRGRSKVFRTPAFPYGSGSDYANAAIEVEFDGSADSLLSLLHDVEERIGRVRGTRWGPRVIDLDLLAFGQQVLPSEKVLWTWIDLPSELQTQAVPRELILPHPRLQNRAFVLIPLEEVAPDWRHPVLGKTVRELRADLPSYLCEEVVPYQ